MLHLKTSSILNNNSKMNLVLQKTETEVVVQPSLFCSNHTIMVITTVVLVQLLHRQRILLLTVPVFKIMARKFKILVMSSEMEILFTMFVRRIIMEQNLLS